MTLEGWVLVVFILVGGNASMKTDDKPFGTEDACRNAGRAIEEMANNDGYPPMPQSVLVVTGCSITFQKG